MSTGSLLEGDTLILIEHVNGKTQIAVRGDAMLTLTILLFSVLCIIFGLLATFRRS